MPDVASPPSNSSADAICIGGVVDSDRGTGRESDSRADGAGDFGCAMAGTGRDRSKRNAGGSDASSGLFSRTIGRVTASDSMLNGGGGNDASGVGGGGGGNAAC